MPDFLLELLSEEIPARMQARAAADLARLFEGEIGAAGLKAASVETFVTPRRLGLIARELPAETAAVTEEIKGPRANAPQQALEGFLRKTGLARNELVERDGVMFAVVERPGRATASVLAEAIPAVFRAFPWPKSMRWGEASLAADSPRWVRPLQGVVALFGDDIVEFELAGVKSGAATVGHRFHHPGVITIGGAQDYADKLRACHVIVEAAERRRIIAEGASRVASEAGLTLVEDEWLVEENAGLSEWPVPLFGTFDRSFLDVPREVIQLTMRANQKYFACTDGDGRLAPHFVCIANVEARDGGEAIVGGNRKVLAARLADARYFWEHDLKVPLDEQARRLGGIIFHEKLGTVADKVERVAKLARWLAEQGIVKGADPARTERAARLAKADLVGLMVGEFPELQGVIGGYLAAAQGEPSEIADAIRDHYKPVGQGDEVPTAPVTVAVSLADKFDTLLAFFSIGELPTGSKDPFALRRSALAIIRLLMVADARLLTDALVEFWLGEARRERSGLRGQVADFLADRLEVQLRESGVRHDFVRASVEWSSATDSRIDRIAARARALQAFAMTPEGANLLTGYKRAANILKRENWDSDGSERAPLAYEPAPEEAALIAALDAEEPKAQAALAAEDFEGAMAALASLRAPVDDFFDNVTVNDPEKKKRAARLNLLARMRAAVHRVADFSKIEG